MYVKELPSQEYLKECLKYIDGTLYWNARPVEHFKTERDCKAWNTRFSGKPAFNCISRNGYRTGALDGINFFAHRVVYKLVYGIEPNIIDHTEKETGNNEVSKLSSGTQRHNTLNQKFRSTNTSGVTGVYWDTQRNKWQAEIGNNGKSKYLGRFENKEDAIAARKAAEVELGYHPNHGKKVSE